MPVPSPAPRPPLRGVRTPRPPRLTCSSRPAAEPASAPADTTTSRTAALVDALIAASAGTDRGSAAPAGARARFDGAFDALAAVERDASTPPPLADARLFGDWDVAFVGVGARQKGQPAGGRFRSASPLRRWLWKTVAVRQAVLPPAAGATGPEVVNRVSFRLAGSVPGHVALRGDAGPVPGAAPDRPPDAVRVVFDPPVLALAPGTPVATGLRLGGRSWVQLSTPYVDGRVRLGVGSLGSKFLFERAAPEDEYAATPASAAVQTTPLGWLALTALTAGLAIAAWALARAPVLAVRPLAAAPGLVCAALIAAIAKDRAVTWFPGKTIQPPREKKVVETKPTVGAAAAT